MYFFSGLTSFLNCLIIITNPIGNHLIIDVLMRMCFSAFCILNVKLNSMLVGRVAFSRFTLATLRTLKHFTNVDNDSKFLSLNKVDKY